MDLMASMKTSASGMSAQRARMQMISENIANADSVQGENGNPYRKKEVYFKAEVDKATGQTHVVVDKIAQDMKTPLKVAYMPGHDMADANGVVYFPNVNTAEEKINMREAARSYEANLSAIETARDMMVKSLDILR